ncbi:hypothetical protein [Nocardioides dilutus]
MPLSIITGTVSAPAEAVVAHPESSHPHVAFPVLLVALAAVMVVVLVASVVPAREGSAPYADERAGLDTASWPGQLSTAQWVTRVIAVAVLALVVTAGRLGADDELENLAPALAVGAGWPLLVLGSLLCGTLWRWLDPWDTIARLVDRDEVSTPSPHVWPAVAVAVPWMWYLSAYSRPLDPRSVGAAVAIYSVVTISGSLALGRARWLGSAEPLGLLLGWIGLVPRRRLGHWQPPRGAGALLGLLIAGLLFGALRRTAWFSDGLPADSWRVSAAGVLVACAIGAGLGMVAVRAGSTSSQRAAAVHALVPAVAGVVLAVALARNRLFTSIQLLPGLVGDPLGRGWDLLGEPTARLDPAPLGAGGLIAVQLCVVALPHLGFAATSLRALVGDERLPVIGVLVVSLGSAMVAVGLH